MPPPAKSINGNIDRLFLDPVIKVHPQRKEIRRQDNRADHAPDLPRNPCKAPVNQFYSKNHGSKRLKKKFNKKFRILSESRKKRHIHRSGIFIHRLGIAPEVNEERNNSGCDQGDGTGSSESGIAPIPSESRTITNTLLYVSISVPFCYYAYSCFAFALSARISSRIASTAIWIALSVSCTTGFSRPSFSLS